LLEYGLLAGLIAVTAIGGVMMTGERVRDVFSASSVALNNSGLSGGESGGSEAEAPLDSHKFNWTILAGTHSNGDTGFYDAIYGSRVSEGSDSPRLRVLNESNSTDNVMVIFDGNHLTEVADHDFACSDGSRAPVADAFNFDYQAEYDDTRIYWKKFNMPTEIVTGEEFTCALIPGSDPDPDWEPMAGNSIDFFSGEYSSRYRGWQSVSPTWGTGSKVVGPTFTTIAIITNKDTGELEFKVEGNTASVDVTGFELSCSWPSKPEGWTVPLPLFDRYISGQNASVYQSGPGYVSTLPNDEDVSCVLNEGP
jgi:Flp pilus assembly pilin Flp